MPGKNTVKQYLENGYYHLYNRGVEKRPIFLDEQDYSVFLNYLKEYLLPKDTKLLTEMLADPNVPSREKDKVLKLLRLNNFHGEITLLAYCLMPNHFHLFVKQKSADSIDRFMQSLGTRYTMYFNRKYKRVGSLFQSVYKAALVELEAHFLYLSAYIHKQALGSQGETLRTQEQPSSYPDYLGKRNTEWVSPEEVLSYFSKTNPSLSYKTFVRKEPDFSPIQNILLED